MDAPRTIFEKIWNDHVILTRPDGTALLHVDRNLVHEGSFHAFASLRVEGRKVRHPHQNFAVTDHYAPTVDRNRGMAAISDPERREMIVLLRENARDYGVRHFDLDDPDQGIVHVIGPELGLSQPGLLITCGDSHTSTHGALGAYAFGIGQSQLRQVLATQTIWQKKPKTMRIQVEGAVGPGVSAKDIVLSIIAKIGAGGATGYMIEYAGSAIRTLSMEGRLTVCNMSIEAGARTGMVSPDDTTFAYLKGRRYAPKGAQWDQAVAQWRRLATDDDAPFDREVSLDAAAIAPMVTWGTSPEDALPIDGVVPEPQSAGNPDDRARMEKALRYMDLVPGSRLDRIEIDRVFIGTCTNGRIEDLRAAAEILKGRKTVVPAWVSPGSTATKRQAEAEGLDLIFKQAGFEWRDSSCSACAAMNGDHIAQGERCASTSNRNFEGRQGVGARTHLVSPAMAAAAAVTGRLTDVRHLMASH
ncbi:3-isopropylmalate dehydratase large subunit [Bordetella tumbae]|uniref:3-isopropylmalate dehydratase large subunit n=1 Tax=Bordetella tumbae TaxID=1649139 RepID=UPI0039EEE2ED